jgi:hypothetical protein
MLLKLFKDHGFKFSDSLQILKKIKRITRKENARKIHIIFQNILFIDSGKIKVNLDSYNHNECNIKRKEFQKYA